MEGGLGRVTRKFTGSNKYGELTHTTNYRRPILDTRISVRFHPSVTLRGPPPLDSEMGWTGELWFNHVVLILENY